MQCLVALLLKEIVAEAAARLNIPAFGVHKLPGAVADCGYKQCGSLFAFPGSRFDPDQFRQLVAADIAQEDRTALRPLKLPVVSLDPIPTLSSNPR